MNERRLAYRKCIKQCFKTDEQKFLRLQNLERLKCLEHLQALHHIENINRLRILKSFSTDNIQRFTKDYQEIDIPNNSIIYCDIPYKNTSKYKHNMDYERFYKWAKAQKNIFISEYEMPDDFECIYNTIRCGHLSATNNSNYKTEKLFIPKVK